MFTREVPYEKIEKAEVVKAPMQVSLALTPECLLKVSIGTKKRVRSGSFAENKTYYMQKISHTPKCMVVHLHREEEDVQDGEHEFYQVVVHQDPAKTRCDCKGFTFHQGITCKHVVAIKALMDEK